MTWLRYHPIKAVQSLIAAVKFRQHVKAKTCGNCQHWNFKVSSGETSFGNCMNEKVRLASRISTTKCDFDNKGREEVKLYAQIQFEERAFGCIYFKPIE